MKKVPSNLAMTASLSEADVSVEIVVNNVCLEKRRDSDTRQVSKLEAFSHFTWLILKAKADVYLRENADLFYKPSISWLADYHRLPLASESPHLVD